jgi:predicted SnoaL-like aldol condensation-catalyzing enzyme
MASNGKPRR